MTVKPITPLITQSTPIIYHHQTGGRFSTLLPEIARTLNKIAIPAIALFALSNLPMANGGPLEYSACTLGCALFCTPAATPACLLACAPLMLLPGP